MNYYDKEKKATVVELPQITVYPNTDLLNFYRMYFPDKSVRQSLYNAENTLLNDLSKNGYFFTTNSLLQRLQDLHRASGSPLVYDWNNQDETLKRFTAIPYPNQQTYDRLHDRMPNGAGRAFTLTDGSNPYNALGFSPIFKYRPRFNIRAFEPLVKNERSYIFVDPFPKDKTGMTTFNLLVGELAHPINTRFLPPRYHMPNYKQYRTVEEYNNRYNDAYDEEHMTHAIGYGVEPSVSNYAYFGDVINNPYINSKTIKIPMVTGEHIKRRVLDREPLMWNKLSVNANQHEKALDALYGIGDLKTINRLETHVDQYKKDLENYRQYWKQYKNRITKKD